MARPLLLTRAGSLSVHKGPPQREAASARQLTLPARLSVVPLAAALQLVHTEPLRVVQRSQQAPGVLLSLALAR
ncbi:MAG: hypothetical protein C0467_07275 [Planctomycetaceae bacterium]|nr:hypothetical protein [Planctomycetaceae bacterium]